MHDSTLCTAPTGAPLPPAHHLASVQNKTEFQAMFLILSLVKSIAQARFEKLARLPQGGMPGLTGARSSRP
jgi:hypothetical protein